MSFSPEADFLILTKGRRYDMLYLMNKMKCIGIALLAMAFLGCKAERAGAEQSPAEAAEKSEEQDLPKKEWLYSDAELDRLTRSSKS